MKTKYKNILIIFNFWLVILLAFSNYSSGVAKSQVKVESSNAVESNSAIVGFTKTSPANGAIFDVPENSYMLLQWTDALIPETDRYQYCIDTTNNNTCDGDNWVTRKGLFSGGPGDIILAPSKTYYWQVRARDAGAYADAGVWWSFTTSNFVPSFSKSTPANGGVIAMPASTYYLLQWTDLLLPATDRYQYCIDQTNNNSCDANNWITRVGLYSGSDEFTLEYGKTYYWQVKARDAGTLANSGAWWSFSISGSAPTFGKTTPANGAVIAMPADTYYLLQWTDLFLPASDGYQYCIDTSDNNTCNTSWITRPNLYSGGPSEFLLEYGKTYYWQVKARDAGTLADGGTWWSFTISGTVPTFNKTTPANGAVFAIPPDTYYLLQWTDLFLPATDRYQYCVDQTNNNSCDANNWITRPNLYSGGLGEFPLDYGKTYYWQVRARDANIYADGVSTWWSFSVSALAVPPSVVSIVRASPDGTNAASVDYTVTFSQSVTGVDISDFYLTTTIGDAFVTGVSGSATTYTVTVNTGSTSGTFLLNFADDDSVQNSQGTPVGGVAPGNGNFAGQVYTINKP